MSAERSPLIMKKRRFLWRSSTDQILLLGQGDCFRSNRHMVGDERALQERNSETILASSFALAIVR